MPAEIDEKVKLPDSFFPEFDPSISPSQKKNLFNFLKLNLKKSMIHPRRLELKSQPLIQIENFSYIDYRNCRCLAVLNCYYAQVNRHLKYSGN